MSFGGFSINVGNLGIFIDPEVEKKANEEIARLQREADQKEQRIKDAKAKEAAESVLKKHDKIFKCLNGFSLD